MKAWSQEDQPIEKLLALGSHELSNAELLAIMIQTGLPNKSALAIAKDILANYDNSLTKLAKASPKELMEIDGIGAKKAARIKATLELARRREIEDQGEDVTLIKGSQAAFQLISRRLGDLRHEEFWVIYLNRRHQVISLKKISQGGINATIADVRIIMRYALELSASAAILCHNHPSGNLKPSRADIALTEKIAEAGRIMEVKIADHLILAAGDYYSFLDEGLL